jgi:hypothetical protein
MNRYMLKNVMNGTHNKLLKVLSTVVQGVAIKHEVVTGGLV